MKRLLAVVIGLALALIGTVAVAAWLSTGSANGSVTAASLAAPTGVAGSSTAGSGDVAVSWTGSAGTLVPTGYYVLRTPESGPAVPACGTSFASPVAATSCTDSSVALGSYTYTVVAVFHSWTRASAPSDGVTVAKANQVVTITSTPTSPTFGGTYTLTATGGGSGNPIVFGSSTAAVCTVSGSTVSFGHAGSCTLTADQAGSTYYNAASQATQTFTVAKASQTASFTSTAPTNAVVGGAGYTPTANGGGSGNPVTFSIDSASSAVCSISAGVVTYQHVGTCVVDADQLGTNDYLDANRVQQSIAVGQGAQAINFTSTAPANAKVNGATYSLTATGGASGNTVTFTSATPSVCTVAGSTVSFAGAGTCTINANQAGNADYLAATQVQQSFAVAKGSQTITFTSTAPASRAAGTTYTPTATASSGLPVAFTVTGACSISSGTVTFGPAAGTCTINANQAGDANYEPAPQQQQTVTVTATKLDQTISFTSTAPSAAQVGGTTYTPVASATSGLPVALTIDASASGICTISGGTVSFNGIGSCKINANQAGNASFNAAPQVQQSVSVAAVAKPTITGCSRQSGNNKGYQLTWTWPGSGTPNGGFTLSYTNLSGGNTISPSAGISSPFTTPNINGTLSGTFSLVAIVSGVSSAPATADFSHTANDADSCTNIH